MPLPPRRWWRPTARGRPCSRVPSALIDVILGEAGRFTANELTSLNHSGDQAGTRLENGVVSTPEGFKEAYAKFIEGGWGAVPFDPDYGGQGLPRTVGTAVNEMVAASNLSFSVCPDAP